jgi:Excalibur calcium-binding domain
MPANAVRPTPSSAGALLHPRPERQGAQAAERGLWGACEATLDPFRAVDTRGVGHAPAAAAVPPPESGGEGDCHASYDPCLPIVDDLDCSAVRALEKAPVRVSGSDPYRLDGDGDGIGCE